MESEDSHYPGNPSEKFLEEKLKLNQVILNMKKIEEAIPILYKIYKEQSKVSLIQPFGVGLGKWLTLIQQSDAQLAQKLQMKDLVNFSELDTKFSSFRIEIERNSLKRLKMFQGTVNELIQDKVNREEFKKAVQEKVNLNDFYFLQNKLKTLEQDKITEMQKFLVAKIQEVDLLTKTKASQAELEVVSLNKIGHDDLQGIERQLDDIRAQIQNLEGDEGNKSDESDGTTPAFNSDKYRRQTRNVYGYGDEVYQSIKQDQKFDKPIGIRKHLKYHQLQINEVWDKLVYDDNRFENMRNEILNQRDLLSQYKTENEALVKKVEGNMEILNRVDDVLSEIKQFKEIISKDHENSLKTLSKTENDWNILGNRFNKLANETQTDIKDNLKRLIKLEADSRQHEHDINILKNDRLGIHKIIAENSILIQDTKAKVDYSLKSINTELDNLRDLHQTDFSKLQAQIEEINGPMRQALETHKREAESLMYELKHVQKESREIFAEFEKSKKKLLDVLDSAKSDVGNVNSLQQTVSMINLDTKILLSNQNASETVVSTTIRNAPMSPVTMARTGTANTYFSKTSLAKLPVLSSKRGYMTTRDVSRNLYRGQNDSDFKSFDGNTIKETEEDEAQGKFFNFKFTLRVHETKIREHIHNNQSS